MNINILEDKKTEIEIMEKVKDAITSFGEIMSGTVSSPSVKHLITVNEEAEKYLRTYKKC